MRKVKPSAMVAGLASLVLVAVTAATTTAAAADDRPWLDPSLTAEQRTELLLAEMTLDEKIHMVHGNRDDLGYAGYVPAIDRLGIPAQASLNSRSGVGNNFKDVTTFPAAVAQSASWDPSLVRDFGKAVGAEVRGKGANIALGPTMNILRLPHWGRSYETYGEDPHLSSRMAVASIKGTQSEHVMANANMYAMNSQESGPDGRNGRRLVSANVDERTMHEIYLPAYEASVKEAKVGSIMCSYNKVNGTYACENEYLLNTVLRDHWEYDGFVMSDWGATHSTVPAALAGLDQEMPGDRYFGPPLKEAVLSGEVSEEQLDDKVRHVLTPMFRIGLFDHPTTGAPDTPVTTPAHGELARTIAEKGAVLLKNAGGALPLDAAGLESMALLGPGATGPMIGGRGSGETIAPYTVTPVDAFSDRLGDSVTVNHIACEFGRVCEAENADLTNGTALTSRWPGYTGYNFVSGTNVPGARIQWQVKDIPGAGAMTAHVRYANGSRRRDRTLSLYLDDVKAGQISLPRTGAWTDWATVQQQIEVPAGTETVSLVCDPGDNCGSNVDSMALTPPGQAPLDGDLLRRQVELAKRSEVAVVFVQDFQVESLDRPSLSLQAGQNELIEAVADVNPNTVVVLNTGGAVLMPWQEKVSGIVEAWYGGQEFGNAIASVLLGEVNPSGKLPMTFPAAEDQTPLQTEAQYPGTPDDQVSYSERLNVGYRWYDATGAEPLYPFGYGLSYTTFEYGNLTVSPPSVAAPARPDGAQAVLVSFDVTNTGDRAGADVAQVYVSHPADTGEPPRQLKGFEKVQLEPGETRRVTVMLDWRAFAQWNASADAWSVAGGRYGVQVGNSSRHLPLTGSLDVTAPPGR